MFPYFDWGWFLTILPFIIIWSMIWKGIGLWKAGRNNQLIWFIAMFVINSVGILPIIYIFFFQKNKATIIIPKAKPKKAAKKKK